ncbi:MAG: carbohydrate ABC transporter permease [Ruminococcus sp.]
MKKIKEFFRYENIGLLYVLPAFIYMLVFVGYPIFRNIVLSFQDVTMKNLISPDKMFVGLKNYIDIFNDKVFVTSLRNTLVFTIGCLIIQFLIGFMLALFFNQNFKIAKPVRGLLMMPWMIPITVTALMFKFIFWDRCGNIKLYSPQSRTD